MMLTKEDALDTVRRTLPVDFDVLEDAVIEREYGWLIFSNSKRYIQSRNFLEMAIGSGGTLVEKKTGRLIQFGSAYSAEVNLRIYEAGYLEHEDADLIVNAVSKMEESIRLLLALQLKLVVPEVQHGTTWRIPKDLTAEQLRKRLTKLPARLHLGSPYYRWKALDDLKKSTAIQFQLVANNGYRNEP